jgi:hypothetical protein
MRRNERKRLISHARIAFLCSWRRSFVARWSSCLWSSLSRLPIPNYVAIPISTTTISTTISIIMMIFLINCISLLTALHRFNDHFVPRSNQCQSSIVSCRINARPLACTASASLAPTSRPLENCSSALGPVSSCATSSFTASRLCSSLSPCLLALSCRRRSMSPPPMTPACTTAPRTSSRLSTSLATRCLRSPIRSATTPPCSVRGSPICSAVLPPSSAVLHAFSAKRRSCVATSISPPAATRPSRSRCRRPVAAACTSCSRRR